VRAAAARSPRAASACGAAARIAATSTSAATLGSPSGRVVSPTGPEEMPVSNGSSKRPPASISATTTEREMIQIASDDFSRLVAKTGETDSTTSRNSPIPFANSVRSTSGRIADPAGGRTTGNSVMEASRPLRLTARGCPLRTTKAMRSE
jgi:hypothetical protein